MTNYAGRDPGGNGGCRYPMDNYDGGRSASEPEHFRRSELGRRVRRARASSDDQADALALAVIALTGADIDADDQ